MRKLVSASTLALALTAAFAAPASARSCGNLTVHAGPADIGFSGFRADGMSCRTAARTMRAWWEADDRQQPPSTWHGWVFAAHGRYGFVARRGSARFICSIFGVD